ncbi:MAG TPA: hydroxymethylglutaryl-CoA reductase, degradative [Chloroflexi bacterium]|jgi:hydroxymethylglutaryl-CoA reductase|nr:hydroxymethylglutaryl-CoA reductase, degradative [Chloroflexota bacterium]
MLGNRCRERQSGHEPTGEEALEPNSRLPNFHRLSRDERIGRMVEQVPLQDADLAALADGGLSIEQADRMIENVVGRYNLPLGIGTNLRVNGRDYLVPMVIEEPSVVAGMSYAARLVREGGGFHASTDDPLMIGQIQVLDVADPEAARTRLLASRDELLALANAEHPTTVSLGGGARDIEVRVMDSPAGPMMVVHLIYDVRDAMGANMVNTATEALRPAVERITGGRVGLRILSNLADRRLARAWCVVPAESLAMGGLTADKGVQRLLEAHTLAVVDPYRAATHNKGIMNGIDAVVMATGNDWRAVEAGAHAYATRSGRYEPLSRWERNEKGDLMGSIELPLAVGTVGGATRVHPVAGVALKILGASDSRELAQVIAAVGLAQNLAALRALAMEGIQRGHMKLHARQIAMAAGATTDEVAPVVEQLVQEGAIRIDRAREILNTLRRNDTPDASGG